MEEGRKHIDDLFREGLEGYREMPDAAVWTSIEQRLPKRGGRRSFLWLWILLMLALLSSLGYYANKHYFMNDAQQIRQETGDPSSGRAITGNSADGRLQGATTDAPEHITDDSDLEKEENPKTPVSEEERLSGSKKRADGTVMGNQTEQVLGEVHGPAKKEANKSGSTLNAKRAAETGKEADPDIASSTATPKNPREATGNKTIGNGTNQAETTENTVKTGQALGARTDNDKTNAGTAGKSALKNEEVKSDPDKKVNNSFASNSNNRVPEPKEKLKPSSEKSKAISQTPEEKNNRLTGQPAAQQDQASKPEAGAKSSSQQSPAAQSPALQSEKKAGSSKSTASAAPNVSLQPEKKAKPSQPSPAVSGNTVLQPGAKDAVSSSGKATGNLPVAVNNEKSTAGNMDPATSKGKPLNVPTEKGGNKPLPATKETMEGAPVSVQAAPDKKKSKMEVTYEDAKGNPINIEPVKEYGIKMDEVKAESDDKADATSGGGAAMGKGSGTGEARKKNGIKIDGGIKLGYDRGFADFTTRNFTGNIFLQWNISKRTSLMLQPGLRFHSINKTSLFPQSAYHQITSATLDSAHVYVDSFGIPQIQRNYIYRNAYDSISVSYGMNPQKYIEIELPLLLQYKLAENLSIFGGMQLAFGKVITIQGNMQRFQGTRIDTFSLPQVDTAQPQTRPGLDGYFGYSTPEIGQLDENKYRNPITNPARFGLMLGFSYEIKKRLLIDLVMRKNLSNLNYIPNEQVRKIYSQPYFRITIGYKLFRGK